ncbi:carbamoyl-phosphate synthase [Geobacillus thermoleovorans]|uniref:ATP-grasp domain-containing protein n=1 Tax=Geobacillus TaxID=129337 RepID=UPI00078B3BFF|nr:ATP-grasp domain-containing protein [Geobacillus sp. DSP4a]AMV12270.1 carbamoyl-phosphate synthase [Geobacillus thermoleovorans]NNU99294.1 ATP-grasp domain-containing protein [Geobacillus sp. DSP4a]
MVKEVVRINVLVTSISKKVPLLSAVRRAMRKAGMTGALIGADRNGNCIGRYFIDEFWEMPSLDDLAVEEFISICRQKRIRFIIPTRDGELPFFSAYRQVFEENGIFVMVSERNAIEICLDKLRFYELLSAQGFPVIPTALSLEELNDGDYVVKERYGAGARNIGLCLTKEEANRHAKKLEAPVFQPFIAGTEISIDLYMTRMGRTKGAVARKRDYVVNGESQITTTIRNEKLEGMCTAVASYLGLYGHAVMQVIIDREGQFHLIECNPRFGGASTLSIEAGLDSFYWFFLESQGVNLNDYPFIRSTNEKKQIRYPADFVIDL